MKQKTISGHYDSIYSIEHNNREFMPANADPARTNRNFDYISVGSEAFSHYDRPVNITELRAHYRKLADMYWEERGLWWEREIKARREAIYELRRATYNLFFSSDPAVCFFLLLLLPLTIPMGIIMSVEQHELEKEIESERFEQWLRDLEFKADSSSARDALRGYDARYATKLLGQMDALVSSMVRWPDELWEDIEHDEEAESARFASVEEIYAKLYEPAFRRFQEKQCPSRRYNGTYLERIREQQAKAAQKKTSKNEKDRSVSEAIEVVFTLGDMDNTGYAAAPGDAAKAETLLKDFCVHLMEHPKLCFVTTQELDDPNWQPPFKHGLIVVNLVVHCDEATPGVHLTAIPYSRGCSRGPEVQPTLGRAMAGMGYPTTYQPVIGPDGAPVQKVDKSGKPVYNKDGSPRIRQTPASKGILDWIEDQKIWLAEEMHRRYDWTREYKGSNPRGNLSTPDYQVARAQERIQEMEQKLQTTIADYQQRITNLTKALEDALSINREGAREWEVIRQYADLCPIEECEALYETAAAFCEKLPAHEHAAAIESLHAAMEEAKRKAEQAKRSAQQSSKTEHEH